MTRRSCLCVLVQISQPWYQFRFAPCACSRHVHDLEPHSKDDTHSTATLHVRHALSGSGLEGDLGDRQFSDTLTIMPLTWGLESFVRLTGLGEAQAEGVVAVLALFLLVLGTAVLAHSA